MPFLGAIPIIGELFKTRSIVSASVTVAAEVIKSPSCGSTAAA